MKKILVFGMTDNPGGVETVIMNYYRHIDKSNIQFDFLCNTEKVAYEEEIKQIGGNIYKITARSKNFKKYKADMKAFFKEHASEYSAIWVNICILVNIDYLKYAKKYGIKHRIIHSHNSQNMASFIKGIMHRINKRIIHRYATDFWTCSEEAGKWFFTKKIRNSNKYLLVRNAIDTSKYQFNNDIRIEYRNKLGISEKFVLGNIGRLHFQKNQTFLLKIMSEICRKRDDAYLLLIGQGEDEEILKQEVKQLNIEDKVMFLGVRDDIPELFQTMDVFLLPSKFEGVPLVLIEAQAAGVDIYASKAVIPETAKMTDNFTFISLDKSPKEWANEILATQHVRKNSTENIEKLKNNKYDIKTEVKKMEKIFED